RKTIKENSDENNENDYAGICVLILCALYLFYCNSKEAFWFIFSTLRMATEQRSTVRHIFCTTSILSTLFPVLTNIFPVLSRHFQFYSVILQQK
ncbi:MAG: hypothetical protein ACI3YZ_05030, partial [Prevotella sp.]